MAISLIKVNFLLLIERFLDGYRIMGCFEWEFGRVFFVNIRIFLNFASCSGATEILFSDLHTIFRRLTV